MYECYFRERAFSKYLQKIRLEAMTPHRRLIQTDIATFLSECDLQLDDVIAARRSSSEVTYHTITCRTSKMLCPRRYMRNRKPRPVSLPQLTPKPSLENFDRLVQRYSKLCIYYYYYLECSVYTKNDMMTLLIKEH